MISRETIASGGSPTCLDCGVTPVLEVHGSAAGYYVGSCCGCGPYSRESAYYATREEAALALATGAFGRSEGDPAPAW